MRSALGLKPTTPFREAGIRTEPPVSVPMAMSATPSATETPAPDKSWPTLKSGANNVHERHSGHSGGCGSLLEKLDVVPVDLNPRQQLEAEYGENFQSASGFPRARMQIAIGLEPLRGGPQHDDPVDTSFTSF